MIRLCTRHAQNNINRLYSSEMKLRSTTILVVKKEGRTVIVGDGQVSLGPTIFKSNANKVKELKQGVVCGFAGSAADSVALMELLEKEVNAFAGFSLLKPCTELAKKWRSDKILRRLEASLLVCDKECIVELDGHGNIFEISNIKGIGSGGIYAECRRI